MKRKGYLKLLVIALSFFEMNESKAQSRASQNPFGLVYAGAITENKLSAIHIDTVSYLLNGIKIAANVYLPANFDPKKTYPSIVIAHPNGGVKEQVSGLYAQALANKGYITIVADAVYQGASSGLPRNIDKPSNRVADITGMIDYISRYKGADKDRIAVLGICGGGGYALKAAEGDKRIKSIATLSMFNSGRVRRNGFQDAQLATVQERLEQASLAKAKEVTTGEVMYMGTAEPTDDEIAKIPTNLYREGYNYYYRTHAHPNSTFRYTASSLIDLMTFDVTDQIELLNQPLLMIAGSKADTFYMTEEIMEKAINAKQKELFLLDGATHIETYWKPKFVQTAVEKLDDFYTKNL